MVDNSFRNASPTAFGHNGLVSFYCYSWLKIIFPFVIPAYSFILGYNALKIIIIVYKSLLCWKPTHYFNIPFFSLGCKPFRQITQ